MFPTSSNQGLLHMLWKSPHLGYALDGAVLVSGGKWSLEMAKTEETGQS